MGLFDFLYKKPEENNLAQQFLTGILRMPTDAISSMGRLIGDAPASIATGGVLAGPLDWLGKTGTGFLGKNVQNAYLNDPGRKNYLEYKNFVDNNFRFGTKAQNTYYDLGEELRNYGGSNGKLASNLLMPTRKVGNTEGHLGDLFNVFSLGLGSPVGAALKPFGVTEKIANPFLKGLLGEGAEGLGKKVFAKNLVGKATSEGAENVLSDYFYAKDQGKNINTNEAALSFLIGGAGGAGMGLAGKGIGQLRNKTLDQTRDRIEAQQNKVIHPFRDDVHDLTRNKKLRNSRDTDTLINSLPNGETFDSLIDAPKYLKAGERPAHWNNDLNQPLGNTFDGAQPKKYERTYNLQDKDDIEYIARRIGEDRAKQIASGDYSHFRNPDQSLGYWEDSMKINLVNETPKTISQQLEGKIKPYNLESPKVYHGTSADNTAKILQGGFKKGSELPKNAFRSGGYGEIQDSISFSTDPRMASSFTGDSSRGVLFETGVKKNSKVVTVKGVDYAEDLNPYIKELRKQGVDAVYLEGEKEVVVINKSKIDKINNHREFDVINSKEQLKDIYNQANSKNLIKGVTSEPKAMPKDYSKERSDLNKSIASDKQDLEEMRKNLKQMQSIKKTERGKWYDRQINPIRRQIKELEDSIALKDFKLDKIDTDIRRPQILKEGRDKVLVEKASSELYRILGTDPVLNAEIRDTLVDEFKRPVLGKYLDGFIQLLSGDEDMTNTARHEAVHYVLDKFMTRKEKDNLLNDVLKRFKGERIYRDGSLPDIVKTLDDAEEFLSERFVDYIRTGQVPKQYRNFFQKMLDRIKTVLGKRDQIEDLFSSMNEGVFKDMKPINANKGVRNLEARVSKNLKSGDRADKQDDIFLSPEIKERGFITSAKESDMVDEAVKKVLKSDYAVYSDKAGLANAEKYINESGASDAVDRLLDTENPGKTEAIAGQILAKMASNSKTIEGVHLSDKILTYLAQKATNAGQFNQSLHFIDKLSPEGVLNYTRKEMKKNGIEAPLTEVQKEKLTEKAKVAETAPEGKAKDKAKVDLFREIADVSQTRAQKFWAGLSNYRYANMLSSPQTQTVNALSNLVSIFGTAPATRFAQGFTSSFKGKNKEIYMRESIFQVLGSMGSIPKAFSEFAAVWKGDKIGENLDVHRLPATSIGGKIVQIPGTLLQAMDSFSKALLEGGEDAALTYREKRSGKKIDNKDGLIKAHAAEYSFTKELDAYNKTGQGSFNSGIDTVSNGIKSMGTRVPLVRWFVPFINTPTNILKQGIEYTPGIGAVLNYKGKTDKNQLIARQMVGSVVFMGAAYMAHMGDATWSAPTGEKEKEAFYASGRQPYSIRIGDKWVSYNKLGPIAYPMALAGAMKNVYEQSPDRFTDSDLLKAGKLIASMGKFFSDQSYVQGIGDVIKLSQGDKQAASRIPSNFMTQLVPASSLQGWVNRNFIDQIQRKPKGIAENLQQVLIGQSGGSSLPFTSKEVGSYKDPEGDDVVRENIVINSWSPVKVTNASEKYDQLFEAIQGKKLDAKISSVKTDANNGEITKEKADQLIDILLKGKETTSQAYLKKYGTAAPSTTGTYNALMSQLGLTPEPDKPKVFGTTKKTKISKPRKGRKVSIKKGRKVKMVKTKTIKMRKPKKYKVKKMKVFA